MTKITTNWTIIMSHDDTLRFNADACVGFYTNRYFFIHAKLVYVGWVYELLIMCASQ